MVLDSVEIHRIEETIHLYIKGYQQKDIDTFTSVLSPSIQGFGSGPDEVVQGREEFIRHVRRDLDQCDHVEIRMEGTRISGILPVAWVMSYCTFVVTAGDETSEFTGRFTVVLRKEDDRWLFEQIHFSLPATGQAAGQSYPSV